MGDYFQNGVITTLHDLSGHPPTHLEKDLSDVHDAKDEEITHLKNEIENLKTKVEIETIRAEIYNLKMLAQQK